MFLLGHLGIGTHLVPSRLRARATWRWLALGCLLPDLLDKPLWLATQLGIAQPPSTPTGTRLFGHTLLLALALLALARAAQSAKLHAVGLGALTHLFLDLAGELAARNPGWEGWLLWPLFGWRFPPGDGHGLIGHLFALSEHRVYVAGEVAGAALLAWDWWWRRRARSAARSAVPQPRKGAGAAGAPSAD